MADSPNCIYILLFISERLCQTWRDK